MNKYVYHGSNNGNIKKFIPRESTQKGKYVYATESIEIAGIFGFKAGSVVRSLGFEGDNLMVCERVKDYMQSRDCPVYIYKFDSKPFEYFDEDNWGKNEVRTKKAVKPIEVIKYDSAVEMLKEFADSGKLNLYFYPDRPDFIPKNDYDLVGTGARLYAMSSKNASNLDMLAGYHPEFKNALDYLIKKIDSLPEDQKRDWASSVYNNKTQKLLPEIEALIN